MSSFAENLKVFSEMNTEQKTHYLDYEFFDVDGKNMLTDGDLTSVFKLRMKRFSLILVSWPTNKEFFKHYFREDEFRSDFLHMVLDAADKRSLNIDVFDILLDSDVCDDDLMGESEENKFFRDFLCDFYLMAINADVRLTVRLKSHLFLFVEDLLFRANNSFVGKTKELSQNTLLSERDKDKLSTAIGNLNVFIESICICFVKAFKSGEVVPWNFSKDEYATVAVGSLLFSCRNLAQRFLALSLFFSYTKDEFQSLMDLFTTECLSKRFMNGGGRGYGVEVGLFNVLFYKFKEGYEVGFAKCLFDKLPELSVDEAAISGLLIESRWGSVTKTPQVFINDCLDMFDENLVKKCIKNNKDKLGIYVYSLVLNDEINAAMVDAVESEIPVYKL